MIKWHSCFNVVCVDLVSARCSEASRCPAQSGGPPAQQGL